MAIASNRRRKKEGDLHHTYTLHAHPRLVGWLAGWLVGWSVGEEFDGGGWWMYVFTVLIVLCSVGHSSNFCCGCVQSDALQVSKFILGGDWTLRVGDVGCVCFVFFFSFFACPCACVRVCLWFFVVVVVCFALLASSATRFDAVTRVDAPRRRGVLPFHTDRLLHLFVPRHLLVVRANVTRLVGRSSSCPATRSVFRNAVAVNLVVVARWASLSSPLQPTNQRSTS